MGDNDAAGQASKRSRLAGSEASEAARGAGAAAAAVVDEPAFATHAHPEDKLTAALQRVCGGPTVSV